MTNRHIILFALAFTLLVPNHAWAKSVAFPDWQSLEKALIKQSITHEWVPMRDGKRLDTHIFLPKRGSGPYPIVLIRSPYPFHFDDLAKSELLTEFFYQGYALVLQNERGRYWSEGRSVYLARAKDDGYDSLEWLSQQPWSNGKVGTIGCSSAAENQLGLASQNHPAHRTAVVRAPGAGIGKIGPYSEQGNIFRGGALQLWAPAWFTDYIMYGASGADHRPQFPPSLTQRERRNLAKRFDLGPNYSWGQPVAARDYHSYFNHLPISNINQAAGGGLTDWDTFSRRTPADPAWQDTHFVNEGDKLSVPMLWYFSWYDIAIAPNIAFYNHVVDNPGSQRAKDNQFLRIGPMGHCEFGHEKEHTYIGERAIGDARQDDNQFLIDWFNHWVKGEDNQVLQRPKVRYYQMGRNQWMNSEQFPPPETTKLNFYLSSQHSANSVFGDGLLLRKPPQKMGRDEFIYDPLSPVPTLGGGSCCMGDLEKVSGSFDQRPVEARQDVLVYTSAPMEQALDLTGPIEAEMYISSSARDTDLTLKLVDVYPDGRAYNLVDTIFRVRYRKGYDKAQLMTPGQIYKITFPPMVTANTFKPGHRIRLEISSSNFPRYDRNLNTGGNNFDETEPVIAKNSIHHGERHPSVIRLSVTTVRGQ